MDNDLQLKLDYVMMSTQQRAFNIILCFRYLQLFQSLYSTKIHDPWASSQCNLLPKCKLSSCNASSTYYCSHQIVFTTRLFTNKVIASCLLALWFYIWIMANHWLFVGSWLKIGIQFWFNFSPCWKSLL